MKSRENRSGNANADRREAALDALVAEYTTLLHLIDRKTTIVATLLTFSVTALAAVVGFLLSAKGDVRLLILVPAVSSIFGLLVAAQDWDICAAQDYVEDVLRPIVVEHTADDRVWAWTGYLVRSRRPTLVLVTRAIPLGLLYPGAGVAALAIIAPRMDSFLWWLAWAASAALVALFVVGWWHQGKQFIRTVRAGR